MALEDTQYYILHMAAIRNVQPLKGRMIFENVSNSVKAMWEFPFVFGLNAVANG